MVLYHHFQSYGYEYKLPVQLGRHPIETVQDSIFSFYLRAFREVQERKGKKIRRFDMELLPYDEHSLEDMICHVLVMSKRLELLVYNPFSHDISGRLEFQDEILRSLKIQQTEPIEFRDVTDNRKYIRELGDILENGLYIKLQAKQAHWFVWEQ